MSTQPEKKTSFKPKFEEKNKIVTKFNFVFDEDKVSFKTQIPELPTKLKSKPNAQKHKQTIAELQTKISSLKQERKQKKSELKKGSQDYDKEIEKLSKNVDLGKKCLVVLNYDLEGIGQSLQQIQQKIQKKTRYLRNLQRGPRQNKQQKKTYEQMTFEQLESEEYLLSKRVSTANLSKKEESQINSLLSKLARMKLNAAHGEKPVDNTVNIEATQQSLERLKTVKESLEREKAQTKNKIDAIQEDIDQFKQQIDDLEEQKKNPEDEAVAESCKDLKEQIYKLRQEVTKLEQQFEIRNTQYEYEQAKVEWINWATEVQKRKNQEWQAEREARRRQRLKEKNKEKTGQNKDTPAQGKTQEEGKPERKKFNKHQKQIDTCTFLISYCEGLVQKEKPQQKQPEKPETGKDIEKALKSGEWSKMKDLEVVKSKKANMDEQTNSKNQKLKKKKTQKSAEQPATETAVPKAFNHQFFTLHAFDSVRVVPPTKPEEVEGILKQLSEKLAYFLEHPDEYIERQPKTERNDKEKQKYTAQKYAKAKFTQREKKVVNTEDFPSLQ